MYLEHSVRALLHHWRTSGIPLYLYCSWYSSLVFILRSNMVTFPLGLCFLISWLSDGWTCVWYPAICSGPCDGQLSAVISLGSTYQLVTSCQNTVLVLSWFMNSEGVGWGNLVPLGSSKCLGRVVVPSQQKQPIWGSNTGWGGRLWLGKRHHVH